MKAADLNSRSLPVYGNPSQPIQVAPGKAFHIALKSNVASSGFGWSFEGSPKPEVLKYVGHRYEAPDMERMGAPGLDVWEFEAVGTGELTLHFTRSRSWEPTSASTTTFTVQVASR
jgi:predicted secreted protein